MDVLRKVFTHMWEDKGGNLQGQLVFLWFHLGSSPLETHQELAFKLPLKVLEHLDGVIILHAMYGTLGKFRC